MSKERFGTDNINKERLLFIQIKKSLNVKKLLKHIQVLILKCRDNISEFVKATSSGKLACKLIKFLKHIYIFPQSIA